MLSYISLGLLLLAVVVPFISCSSFILSRNWLWQGYGPRVVGGEATTIEVYPYIVQMESYRSWTGTWNQGCGANILTAYWVMSAAHCFAGWNYSPQYRRFRAGSTYRSSGGVIHYVDYATNHPDYQRYSTYDADINVVRLSTPLVYSPVIQKGTLIPQDTELPDGHPVIHAGWGTLKSGGVQPRELQHVQMFTINNELCARRYREARLGTVTKNMICGGLLDVGGRDACQGDSGGPLYAQGENTHVIVGVVFWGHGCANGTYPGLSTRVASYTNWVIANAV